MKLKYLLPFIFGAIFFSQSLSAQYKRVKSGNVTEISSEQAYSGLDSNFIEGRNPSIGRIRCPLKNSSYEGMDIFLPYRTNKKGNLDAKNIGELTIESHRTLPGRKPLTALAPNYAVEGAKIKFSVLIKDQITWCGKLIVTFGQVYIIYNSSNGRYSIKIIEEFSPNQ